MRRSLVGGLSMEGFERWSDIDAILVQVSTKVISIPVNYFKATQPTRVVFGLCISMRFEPIFWFECAVVFVEQGFFFVPIFVRDRGAENGSVRMSIRLSGN